MSIRKVLNQALAGDDPARALAEHGFDDISAEALSSALVHFAESAPMSTADALAPWVTRMSPVPFEAGDLPEAGDIDGLLDSQTDALSLLGEVGQAEGRLADALADPTSELDDVVDTATDAATEAVESAGEALPEIDEAASTFGVGGEDAPGPDVDELLDDATDSFGEAAAAGESFADGIDELDGLDTATFTDLFDQATNAASIDDLDGTDPSELDDFE